MDKSELWRERHNRSRRRLQAMLEEDTPSSMIQDEARNLLNTCYGGPWRAIWVLIRYELGSVWGGWAFDHFERVRVKVFRRTPDPVLQIAERIADEDREVEKMIRELN